MAKSQRRELRPPIPSDRQTLQDFTSAIQYSFQDLFRSAHDHTVLASDPAAQDGSIQQVSIVDTGSTVYLVVKTSRGWFKSPAFTAL